MGSGAQPMSHRRETDASSMTLGSAPPSWPGEGCSCRKRKSWKGVMGALDLFSYTAGKVLQIKADWRFDAVGASELQQERVQAN